MKQSQSFFPCFVFAALLVLCACFAHAQVSVAIAPQPFLRFTNATGSPLAGGFLYTYQAGTTTLQNTYVDSLGMIQNPDPIPLDATGAPSNGSVQTMIWLGNLAYKFCLYDANLVPQGCKDNLTGYLGLLNLANTWTFQQTFSLPIVDTSTDNQMVFGAFGNQTTLDFPPPAENITLHFPNVGDTVVGRQTPDTLINKTLSTPLFNSSGCGIVNGPGTYICVVNANPTGTTTGTLTKLINAPSQATIAALTDVGGIQGICVAGCGNTGTATIQQSSLVPCVFDGPTIAGDYVGNSPTVVGDCHDTGAAYPIAGQPVGRVFTTNAAAGTYQIDLFPPELPPLGVRTIATAIGGSVPTTGTATFPILVRNFPAGALNSAGKAFRMQANFTISPNSSITSIGYFGWGGTSALGNYSTVVTQTASASQFTATLTVTCVVLTPGVSASAYCGWSIQTTAGTISTAPISVTSPLDLTQTLFVGPACSFSAGSGNTCNAVEYTLEQLN